MNECWFSFQASILAIKGSAVGSHYALKKDLGHGPVHVPECRFTQKDFSDFLCEFGKGAFRIHQSCLAFEVIKKRVYGNNGNSYVKIMHSWKTMETNMWSNS